MSAPVPITAATATGSSTALTPLEQQVLDEYAKLLDNLHRLSNATADLADLPAANIMDSLRELERKTGLVFTLLKASVYSLVLQQELGEQENKYAEEGPSEVGGETMYLGSEAGER